MNQLFLILFVLAGSATFASAQTADQSLFTGGMTGSRDASTSQPLFYDKYSQGGRSDYFSPQGDHITTYQVTPGMSQYFSQDRNGHSTTGYVFDHSAKPPSAYVPLTTDPRAIYEPISRQRR